MGEQKQIGCPRKFKSPQAMKEKIKEYFQSCWKYKVVEIVNRQDYVLDPDGNRILEQYKPYTVLGLCLFLGIDRHTLQNYEKDKDFLEIITNARMVISEYKHRCLYEKDRKNLVGIIFDLKVNEGWDDKRLLGKDEEDDNIIEIVSAGVPDED